MKISSKIAAGFAGLIVLLFAIVAQQWLEMDRLQKATTALSATNFRAALLALQLLQDLAQVDEFTRKALATGGDPDYVSQASRMRESFGRGLETLRGIPLSPAEETQINELALRWSRLRRAEQPPASPPLDSPPLDSPPLSSAEMERQLALLESVRLQVELVVQTTRAAIVRSVNDTAEAARRAGRISLGSALLALAISIIVAVWIVRSISRPLDQLTAGTRAVAAGDVSHQIEVPGADELAQLAADFNSMTRRLGELDQLKRDFVSHASHELKTPLASMQETIRLLLDDLPGPLNEQQRRLLELNLRSIQRLSAMIRNLLDLSRMEAGVMEYAFEWHDLRELARAALSELEGVLREKQLVLEMDLPERPCVVQCDGDRLIQVIANLTGNAAKFSPAGAAIRVSLRQVIALPEDLPALWRLRMTGRPQTNLYAVLSIADSGPGVPSGERLAIFEKFHQVKSGSAPGAQTATLAANPLLAKGTGLGLAISRTIVEAHRGAIWVTENANGGSVFHVLLAVDARAPMVEPADSAPL